MLRQRYMTLLDGLRADLLAMGTMVEQALDRAIASLPNWDAAAAEQVIQDDAQINAARNALEDRATTLLATQQPVAGDLRLLSTVVAVATELERVGDYTCSIARRVVDARHRSGSVLPPAEINEMATLARNMLHKGLEALLHQDSDLARSLAVDDDRVDALRDTLRDTLLAMAHAEPRHVAIIVDLVDVLNVLERIADRATNIGERVIYLVNSSVEELNP